MERALGTTGIRVLDLHPEPLAMAIYLAHGKDHQLVNLPKLLAAQLQLHESHREMKAAAIWAPGNMGPRIPAETHDLTSGFIHMSAPSANSSSQGWPGRDSVNLLIAI